jgi:hypothetical protein
MLDEGQGNAMIGAAQSYGFLAGSKQLRHLTPERKYQREWPWPEFLCENPREWVKIGELFGLVQVGYENRKWFLSFSLGLD